MTVLDALGRRDVALAQKVISGVKRLDVIEVKVKLTAYHSGWFEFRLCKPTNQSVTSNTPTSTPPPPPPQHKYPSAST